MSDHNYRMVGDAPGGWDGYARLLREHGGKRMRPEVQRGLEENWENRLAKHRRARNLRWGIGLPSGAVLITGIVLSFGLFSDQGEHSLAPTVAIPSPSVPAAEPEAFANPAIPPVWYDTSFPSVDAALPTLPHDSGLFRLDSRIPSAADSPVAGEPIR